MRRAAIITGTAVLASVALAGAARPVWADPTPGVTSMPAAVPGTAVCVVRDPSATELSGLVATPTGYVSINDSRDDPSQIRVFYLDQRCRVTRSLHYPTPARDPEDLAQAPDGTLWVADTGDNVTDEIRRTTVALWHVPGNGGAPVIHRLTYPDGPHDAEALFFTPSGVPVIVTKELDGHCGIYEPTGPLKPRTAAGVPLRRVGEFRPTPTGVPNDFGVFGEVLVTGAATSPDRRRVALRTYTAAYEWDVPDGDPVKTMTTSAPRVTVLPGEPQGESLAYTPDGRSFLTVSDEAGPTTLRRYTPTPPTPGAASPSAGAAATSGPLPSAEAIASTLGELPGWVMVGVAAGGLGLAAAGIIGMRRGRRRPRF